MIRNALYALRRAPAASLRRATPPGHQLVRHPSLPPQSRQSPAFSSLARGLHGVSGGGASGLLRTHAVPPPAMSPAAASVIAARRLSTAAGRSMGSNSLEKEKSALLKLVLEEEAASAAAAPREELAGAVAKNQWELKPEKEGMLRKEAEARRLGKKVKTEELLAQIGRQAASGAATATDTEALLLARLARAEQEMEELKKRLSGVWLLVYVGYGYLLLQLVRVVRAIKHSIEEVRREEGNKD